MAKIVCVCEQCGKEFITHSCYLKRGGGRFCSPSCSTTYRNLKNNPSWNPEVRKKISENHADVSGENNPMYGKRGKDAPSYIDGRSRCNPTLYKGILIANGIEPVCKLCGAIKNIHVHHIDGNRKNNDINNLVWLCTKCHYTVAHKYERDDLGRYCGSKLNEKVEYK